MSQPDRTHRVQLLDLVGVVAIAILATVTLLVSGLPWQLRWALGVPFLIFVPGYAIVAAVLPTRPGIASGAEQVGSPDWATRGGLALLVSTLLLAVVGTLLSFAGELRLTPIVVVIDVVVAVGTLIALTRRKRRARAHTATQSSDERRTGTRLGLSGVQTIALIAATLVLLGSLAFVGGAPGAQSSYSEMALLSEPDGVALGTTGPVTWIGGESNVVYVRLENHEGTETTYRIVAELQRVGEDGTVIAAERLDTTAVTLSDGETVVIERELTPTLTGEDLRLRYLVYTDEVPEDPSPETAPYSLRIWLDVVGGNTS